MRDDTGSVVEIGGSARTARSILTPDPFQSQIDELSPQETRVLEQVVEGYTNKEIGQILHLSPKTVKNYLSNAFQKLHVRRRSRAAALFVRRASSAASRK